MLDQASPVEATYFTSPEAFRAWLNANAMSASELVVGFYKQGSGHPSITWPQAVDEALCVGWVDGVRHRIDELRYKIRFTPRKPSSTWSAVNIERVRVLTEQGRMKPAGHAAFARRTEKKSQIYSYEQAAVAELTPAELKLFCENKAAWTFFEQQAPSYRKKALWLVVSAKQQSTRERRLAVLIAASENATRL